MLDFLINNPLGGLKKEMRKAEKKHKDRKSKEEERQAKKIVGGRHIETQTSFHFGAKGFFSSFSCFSKSFLTFINTSDGVQLSFAAIPIPFYSSHYSLPVISTSNP